LVKVLGSKTVIIDKTPTGGKTMLALALTALAKLSMEIKEVIEVLEWRKVKVVISAQYVAPTVEQICRYLADKSFEIRLFTTFTFGPYLYASRADCG